MKGSEPVRELLAEARDLLERERIPYAVMGGIAASAWGMPHSTHDVGPDPPRGMTYLATGFPPSQR